MTIAFPLAAFAGAFLATFRSLGWRFLAVLAVGYFHGVIRANFPVIFRTFLFETPQPLAPLDRSTRILLDGPLVECPTCLD